MDGILNILKPPGMTSHDVVYRIRRLTKVKRTGHTGTLDPGAAGVLPVCVGKATRVAEYVLETDKNYRAELTLGTATDTEDAAGEVIKQSSVPVVSVSEARRVLAGFLGPGHQIPPMYSAVRKNGVKLYTLARRGESVEREPRAIHIYNIELVRLDAGKILFDVQCSRGTYIRTLCVEIAEKLGSCGHMSFLLRTAVGPFQLDQSYTLEELNGLEASGMLSSAFMPPDTALLHIQPVCLSAEDAVKISHGISVPVSEVGEGLARVYSPGNIFLAVAEVKSGVLKPVKVFPS
ncbi:MAG: tRNA pseudouridine(55) synthase TruB [Clostridiales bacterium]|jgi:tRNA pseudouridine55 synthase|nr:tRNA pseudouridine(55) synthase TruB [Clostridiales bacterium]